LFVLSFFLRRKESTKERLKAVETIPRDLRLLRGNAMNSLRSDSIAFLRFAFSDQALGLVLKATKEAPTPRSIFRIRKNA
jgi:hypothetical protein